MSAWRQSLVWKIALPVPLALIAMIAAIALIVPRQIDADTQANRNGIFPSTRTAKCFP